MTKKMYLGDGVYAEHDGYQIWLSTLEGSRIALEPEVLFQLNKYAEQFKQRSQATNIAAPSENWEAGSVSMDESDKEDNDGA